MQSEMQNQASTESGRRASPRWPYMRASAFLRMPPPAKLGAALRSAIHFNQRTLDALEEAARTGASVTRFWLVGDDVYFVNDPAAIRRVLLERRAIYSRRENLEAPWLRALLGDGLLTIDEPRWLEMRRAAQPAFLQSVVQSAGARVVDAVTRALDQATIFQDAASDVDVFSGMVGVMVAVMTRSFFDVDVGAERAAAVATAMLQAQAHIMRHLRNPFTLPDSVPTPANRRFQRDVTTILEHVNWAIRARRARPPRDEVLDLYGAIMARIGGEDEREAREQLLTGFTAAPENTATAVTWSLYLLARHPAVRARVVEELDRTLGGRPPTADDLRALPYLAQVLDETLRLYPGAPYFDRRALEDDVIAGVRIPAGSLVMIAPYALHRTPAHWANPDAFLPERFAPNGEGRGHPAYLPFGLGPRRCIGDHFALMAARLVLAVVLQRFEVTRDDPTAARIDPQINLRPADGMQLRLRRRAHLAGASPVNE